MNPNRTAVLQDILLLIVLAVVSAGCSSTRHTGAAPMHCSAGTLPAGAGSLKVYSAEAWMSAQDDTFSYTRSPYQILTPAGHCYMNVANQRRRASEEPQTVRLPAGDYVVVAEDAKRGRVSMPVTIAGGQMSVLHLD